MSGRVELDGLRAELARGLAAALAETSAGGVKPAEAGEAALSVLDGHGIPAALAARMGESPACSLVAFDADRIQSWVFASERVQVAKGASETLMHIQRAATEMIGAVPGLHGVVTSAGGGGILVASAARDLSSLEADVRRWLERASCELTFTVVAEPLRACDLARGSAPRPLAAAGVAALDRFALAGGIQGALARLQVRVRQAKDACPRAGGAPVRWELRPGTAVERCPSCGRRPRGSAPAAEDGPAAWCDWCNLLRGAFKLNLYQRHDRWITFSELAEASNRRRQYLGFVAVDGNGMGDVAQRMGTLLELRAFSEATTAIYEAAKERIDEVLAPGVLAPGWSPSGSSLSFLSGGDEITVALPAAAAPRAAAVLLRAIEEGYDRATESGGLLGEAFRDDPDLLSRLRSAGAAAGVVIASPQYPVRLLRRYAEILQKEAKQAAGRSGVAWMLLTDSSPLPEAPRVAAGADLGLPSFERLLAEAAAATAVRVPSSALHQLVGQARDEAQSVRSLPAPVRGEVVDLLAANFFRYQLARSAELAAWWREIETGRDVAAPTDGGDAIGAWFRAGGARRIERLTEILSLDPVDSPAAEVAP